MKFIFTFVFVIFTLKSVVAQFFYPYMNSYSYFQIANKYPDIPKNSKLWKEGNLEITDFKATNKSSKVDGPGEINYVINYQNLKIKSEGNVIVKPVIFSYIDTEKSFLNTKDASIQESLFYFQVLFDYIELRTRFFQKDLDNKLLENQYFYTDFLNSEIQNAQKDIQAFNQKIAEANTSNLVLIKDTLTQLLNQNPIEILPKNVDRNFGFAYGFGMSNQFIGNNTSDIKNLNFGFSWYTSALYKKFEFCFDMNFYFSRFKNLNYSYLNGNSNNSLFGGFLGLYTGYTVLNTQKSRILPYVGVAFMGFSLNQNQNNPVVNREKYNLNSFGYFIGLSYDLKIRTKYIFGRVLPLKNDFNVRFKLSYLPPYSTQKALFDNTFLVSVLLSGNTKFIKKYNQENRKIDIF